MQRMRAVLALILIIPFTLLCLPVQWLALRLNLGLVRHLPVFYHRVLCRIIGIRIQQYGEPSRKRPVLITANHASWIDIVILGSLMPLSFIAKSEVGTWPGIGTLARLQRSVFVDRQRRSRTGDVANEISARLQDGDPMVLFAEGTSSCGNHVLPFRSALVGAAQKAITAGDETRVWIQPLGIAYTGMAGLPVGRQHRPWLAWYGDMDLVPHLMGVLGIGAIDVAVIYCEPIAITAEMSRKQVTQAAEKAVRDAVTGVLRGRPTLPALQKEIAPNG